MNTDIFSRTLVVDRVCSKVTLALLLIVAGARVGRSETVAYQPREGQQFGYEIKAEADRGTHVDKLSGTIVYTVKSVTDGKFTLAWTSNVRLQESARAAGRGGPGPRPAFATLPSPGGQNGTLQINSQGDVVSTKDAAHLPYLLGDAALLMIETLPETGRGNWKLEKSVTLAETGERLPGPPRGS